MTIAIRPISIVFISAALLFTATASGEQIYRWVGAEGETHFSEIPPDADPAAVEILEVVAVDQVSPPPRRDYRSALEVAKDIESSRLERERLRLEKKRLLLQNRRLRESAMIPQEYDDDYSGVRLFYSPFYRHTPKPLRHHHFRRPVYPRPYSSHRWGRPGHGSHAPSNARVYIRQ